MRTIAMLSKCQTIPDGRVYTDSGELAIVGPPSATYNPGLHGLTMPNELTETVHLSNIFLFEYTTNKLTRMNQLLIQ